MVYEKRRTVVNLFDVIDGNHDLGLKRGDGKIPGFFSAGADCGYQDNHWVACAAAVRLGKERKVYLSRYDWLLIAMVALSSITLHQILLAWGVQSTSAGNASLILSLNPLATALLAAPLLGELLTKRKALGITVGFAGVLIVVTSQSGDISLNGWGDLIVFGSMLVYVVGGLFIRKATDRGIPVLVVTAYSHAIGSVMLWVTAGTIYPMETLTTIDTRPFTWLVILASALLSSAMGTVGWNYGHTPTWSKGKQGIFLRDAVGKPCLCCPFPG